MAIAPQRTGILIWRMDRLGDAELVWRTIEWDFQSIASTRIVSRNSGADTCPKI